jgi:hypothetical protein
MGWTARVGFPAGARNVSLLHSVQTGTDAYPAFYQLGIEESFTGGKVAGA